MPPSQQSWYKPGLRFCGSCLVSLFYWAMWLTLTATLVALIYVAVVREIPVPDFVLRQVETKLAEADLGVKFGHARLDPSGKILLEDVQLRSKQFNEPILKSRFVYLRRNIWSILAGRPIPDEIKFEGATLQLPAVLSPSGTAEPVIRDLCAAIRHDDNDWHIDQLTGLLGPLKILISGDINIPRHSTEKKKNSPPEITAKFFQIGRSLILEVAKLEAFDQPFFAAHLENDPFRGNLASCTFTADAAHQPWGQPIELGPLSIATTIRLDGPREQMVRFEAETRTVSKPDRFSLENLHAIFDARLAIDAFLVHPATAKFWCGALFGDGESIEAPFLSADLSRWPAVKIAASLQIGGEVIAAGVDADMNKKSALITIDGSGAPEIINRILAKHTPRAAPFFVFGDPVVATAEAEFSPGWHFVRLASRVVAGRINSRGVKITSARGRIDIKGMDFLAYDAQVEMGQNVARGSYWMNFPTTDYRMLLTGRLRPPEIEGWFNGEWWSDFWNKHFVFPNDVPEGDVDLQGRWRDVAQLEFFGAAKTNSARIWGGNFDQAQATVFLRPSFVHVINFNGTRANKSQQVSGSLKHFADEDTHETKRLEFDLESNVDPETYHSMLEGKVDDVLAPFRFSILPRVRVQGHIDNNGHQTTTEYKFSGKTDSALRYYGFPLTSISAVGHVENTQVQLDEIHFATAGGEGAGKATLSGPADSRRLGFDLYLNGADLPQAIRAVQEYEASQDPNKKLSGKESTLLKRASGGRLDIAMSAQGSPGELSSFLGTGNAAVTRANLGEIQLFGLLSQALSGLSLNFSSLRLDSAHTSFRMEKGRVRFPDLKITGPSAVIDAHGDFDFANNGLDFTAKFKPFEETNNLLTAAIGIVIKPITSILELKLTGTLDKPNWSIDVGALVPRHESSIPKEKPQDVPVVENK